MQFGLGNSQRVIKPGTRQCRRRVRLGVVAFTARRPNVAEQLAPQEGLYTLITHGAASCSQSERRRMSEIVKTNTAQPGPLDDFLKSR
jgi:mannitol-1-phosphate/altronate dehydrogenase